MYSIGYDFKDTYFNFCGLSFALRLSTEINIYAPCSTGMQIEERDNSLQVHTTMLSAAGGQLTCPGSMRFTLRKYSDKRIGITASATHPKEKCKSIMVFVRGIDVTSFCSESKNMGEKYFVDQSGIEPICYPGRDVTMPLVFVKSHGPEWFMISKDREVRKKSFSAYYDYSCEQKVLILSHEEDARKVKNMIDLPEWQIGSGFSRLAIVKERCADLENYFNLKPYSDRLHAIGLEKIKTVINFHGEHWTGHIFNTFDEMSERLKWLCRYTDGKSILAFLPAWDGRYYFNYPEHRPSERMGGEEGLKRFVNTAHSLGTKVVLMLGGPNLATFNFLDRHHLMDAALKSRLGFPILQDWVDWDNDLSKECMGFIVNFGHPVYREYMLDCVDNLIGYYGVDGVFLDGALRWENCPDYSPYEGLTKFCKEFKNRHPKSILMGEDGFDATWGLFDLFATSWQPLGLENSMLRYTRQSYYLSLPAENGSGGVHEQAWYSNTAEKAIEEFTIPTISIIDNIIENYTQETIAKIKKYSDWSLKLPEIAMEKL